MAKTLDPMDLKQIITLHIDGVSNRKIRSIHSGKVTSFKLRGLKPGGRCHSNPFFRTNMLMVETVADVIES